MHLEKAWIHLFSLKCEYIVWQLRLFSFGKATRLGEWKLCIQTNSTTLKIDHMFQPTRELHISDCLAVYKGQTKTLYLFIE